MKLTVVLLSVGMMGVHAKSFSQKNRMDVSIKNGTLTEVFKQIQKQTDYLIFYKDDLLIKKETDALDLDLKNATISDVLDKALKKSDLTYRVVGRQIAITRKELSVVRPLFGNRKTNGLTSISEILVPERIIKGAVKDAKGQGLPGAAVKVKGTTRGVLTDQDGNFSLDADAGEILEITFIGYIGKEVVVTNQSTLNIQLADDVAGLEELVVVGYGATRKKDLTGSVVSIKADEISKSAPITLEQGIQGKAAGVFVTQTDGAPGSGMSVQIRGTNSFLGGTEPLYVIDGVPMTDDNSTSTPGSGSSHEQQKVNMLSFLSTNDIESIEILKDASATAIYGSRGANGVVLVTTKKGTKGQDRIDFNLVTSLSKLSKKYNLLNAEQFAEYQNEAYRNSDKYLGTTYEADNLLPYPGRYDEVQKRYLKAPIDFRGQGTDWQDQIYQVAAKQDYSLSFSGGSNGNTYLISGNVVDQAGIISNSKFKRYSLRANISRNVKSWLQVGTNINYTNTINKLVTTGASIVGPEGGVVKSALTFLPTVPLKDSTTGQFTQLYFTSNPYQYTRQALNKVTGSRLTSSSFAEISFSPNLRFRSILGWFVSADKRDQYFPQTINEGNSVKGRAFSADNNGQSISSENYFTYDKKTGIHTFNATAGMSYGSGVYQWKEIGVSGFMNDALENNNLGAATIIGQPASGKSSWKMISYYGRLNYILNEKYLFTATYRRDGSSKFAVNNKWAGFLSGAAAWRISEEEPLKGISWLSNLKARLSYGQSGNQGIGAYGSLSQIAASNYPYGGTLSNGYVVSTIGNDNLRWETTNQMDAGLDIGLWEDKVTFVVDYYFKRTKDLLQNVTLPTSTGFSSQLRNIGEVENKGFEVSVFTRIKDSEAFKWNVSGNISFNRNKITDLGDVQEQWVQQIGTEPVNYQPFIQRVGQPIGIIMGYKENGIFQTQEEVVASGFYKGQPDAVLKRQVGEIRYTDTNNDKVIDNNDRVVIGNINPDFYYGLTNNFFYKGFDLSVFFQGVYGGKIINTLRYITDNMGSFSNTSAEAYANRWTGPNSTGTNPKAILNSFREFKFSDRFVEDGSYLRLKNINLGYNFTLKDKKVLQSLRLYGSVNNLFTITNYSGYDPEVNGFGQDPSRRGVDLGNYPNSQTFSLGINCTF